MTPRDLPSHRRPLVSTTIAVLGDGGWGTTLAIYCHRLGHRVRWWSAFPDYVKLLRKRRENVKYLPGIPIPPRLSITADLAEAVGDAELLIVAVPSQYLRCAVVGLKRVSAGHALLSVAKGIESNSLKRMSEVIREELGPVKLAALSGPNIAHEIARGFPASAVVASEIPAIAARIQQMLSSERLRLYTSTDLIGVELGGALKNPLAIAAGISDGLGFGANAKAALITRGVVEMVRLGSALGGRRETFWGLSGLGDLVTTCLAGRNHWLGQQIGAGRRLREVLAGTPMVIEGVETSKAAAALGRRVGAELPIIEQVHAILFRGRHPRTALRALMRRDRKAEFQTASPPD
ncbi:MAG: NAD(P)-dependent glycerol-3-phosphate dehydrogenase [Candidatus Omnitrophica bacterium]|nr:NAD(P)-dependent glycerol-3-phosphate dehydrogenase [Candidatus Omnitrophota bacterium]